MYSNSLKSKRYILVLCCFLSFFISQKAFCETESKPHGQEKKFDPGKTIMDHIADAHEWHIATIGTKHISIPLPVILYDEGKIVAFMSSRFHHGTEAYKGYQLNEKGKIVKVDESAKPPLDFSITKNVVSLFFSVILICWMFISVARRFKNHQNEAPKGLQSWLEPLILFVRDDIARPSIGEKRYERYMPYLLTVFFFIFINNLLGLIPFFPGGANLTGNISVTMVLALFTFIITTVSANKHYWKEIYNAPGVPWWLKFGLPIMPIVEIIGVVVKPFVLMVRLFANITAGHIIALGFISLIFIFGQISTGAGYGFSVLSVLFYVFMGLLELLVAFIQAYVFTLLSALYFGMAMAEHHEEAH
ncbi:MAG TPA: F0F1 ATP synthase subunit A [Bacteroidales bacterium]|mgnify:FL=1|nr:F0F1 ATP synthase subunit A [Bacteroidales bacterium]HNZ42105.1 F0F1 ATP synthase subunit A [Bacteroidales bacterium]HOH83086.1 F0F1 ATP synthase subunit A [Bacteroidales bacterium]HPB24354.1 F0F1 ATP synthase subunit A [Bacteroidales bacterium]HQN15303.1 F0F1 ATP synthase subunit A [Bacteroidales bacterium]